MPLQINRLLMSEPLGVLFMIHQALVSTRTLEEPLKYHSYPVLYLKIKFKPGFLNFHVGKAKTGNLWTHFGYTSPIAWVFDLSL
jgi:hypothetical protein